MELGFSETVLIAQLPSEAVVFCASRLHCPEQPAIATILSLLNTVHMLPQEGVRALRASK